MILVSSCARTRTRGQPLCNKIIDRVFLLGNSRKTMSTLSSTTTTTTSSKAEAIKDWNDAYDNIGHIPNATNYFDQWTKQAQDFIKTRCNSNSSNSSENNKESTTTTTATTTPLASCKLNIRYGPNERQIYDLFVPSSSSNSKQQEPKQQQQQQHKGIFIFVHGGYWYRFDKSYFSHLAEGPLTKGYIVAMPSYRLCPNVKIADITQDITKFIQELITKQDFCDNTTTNLPIILCGHSAGGTLVTRQVCYNDNDNDDNNNNNDNKKKPILDKSILQRITQVISISGVHDLRPILRIVQNENIQLQNEQEAMKESPALLKPVNDDDDNTTTTITTTTEIICIVGSDERPEFIRQNDLLANIWKGMGMATTSIHIEGKHHFNIIDDLIDPNGNICSSLP